MNITSSYRRYLSRYLINRFNRFESMSEVPLSYAERKRKAAAKIQKYIKIPEVLATAYSNHLPPNRPASLGLDDLIAIATEEYIYQMNRLYGLVDSNRKAKDMGKDKKYIELFNSIYVEKSKDLRVGPFFRKGMKKGEFTYKITGEEAASLRYIKIALFNASRDADPLPKSDRDLVRKLQRVRKKFQNTLKKEPSIKELAKALKWPVDKVAKTLDSEDLALKSIYYSSINDNSLSDDYDDY